LGAAWPTLRNPWGPRILPNGLPFGRRTPEPSLTFPRAAPLGPDALTGRPWINCAAPATGTHSFSQRSHRPSVLPTVDGAHHDLNLEPDQTCGATAGR
jgi:hypothetical protein